MRMLIVFLFLCGCTASSIRQVSLYGSGELTCTVSQNISDKPFISWALQCGTLQVKAICFDGMPDQILRCSDYPKITWVGPGQFKID